MRDCTIEQLCTEFVKNDAPPGIRKLGVNRFRDLANKMTVMVAEEQCLDYYYTEGVIQVFATINRMMNRLQAPEDIVDLVQFVEYFVKHKLKLHFSVDGNVDGMHCLYWSVNGQCSHEHTFNCYECNLIEKFWDTLKDLVDRFVININAEEQSAMIGCLQVMRGKLRKFIKHLARAVWQKGYIDTRLREMGPNTIAIYIDHKKKVVPNKNVDSVTVINILIIGSSKKTKGGTVGIFWKSGNVCTRFYGC